MLFSWKVKITTPYAVYPTVPTYPLIWLVFSIIFNVQVLILIINLSSIFLKFALDTCSRCYRYIPDQATFFVKKWNQSVVSVKTEPSGLMYNVTYLVDSRDQLIVSSFYI